MFGNSTFNSSEYITRKMKELQAEIDKEKASKPEIKYILKKVSDEPQKEVDVEPDTNVPTTPDTTNVTPSNIVYLLTGIDKKIGDMRYLASQFPRQAWAKNNNPAGLTYNERFKNPDRYPQSTAWKLRNAGIKYFQGTARPE